MIAPIPVHCFSITLISERVFTIYGHGGPDPKPSLPYNTSQIKFY